ncbi:MAG: hypothetical protein WA705_07660 [Candidatus Ozemobacteraceae bacterium]
MRKSTTNRILTASLMAGALVWAIDAQGQSPFDENKALEKPKTAASVAAPASQGMSTADLQQLQLNVGASNRLAGGDYHGFLVAQPVIEGTITFADGTKDYQRYAWFKQILGEHYSPLLSESNKETTTGSFLNKKRTLNISARIRGRGFVVKAIKEYYGGTLAAEPGQPTAPTDPQFKGIVDKELANQQLELDILKWSFEVDKLLVERNGMGMLDLSGKSRVDKALADLKENRIPNAKNTLAANNDAIRTKFLDLADAAIAKKDYNQAIALIATSGDTSQKAKWSLAGSYQGLGQYDKAIEYYKASNNGDKAYNGIADCQHAKGSDRDALNTIYTVVNDFHGTPEELSALAKIEEWKLRDRTSEFPELPQKISGVYLEKGIQNSAKNRPQAVKDYSSAVDVLAAGGSKAAASTQIVNNANNANQINQQALFQSKMNADQRFMNERYAAQGQANAWQTSYTNAAYQAKIDYGYELSRKRKELESARQELDYLTRNPPAARPPTSTDPYNGSSGTTSGTDPYSSKPSTGGTTSTDPYSSKPSTSGNTSTDPYAKKPTTGNTSSSDPYASKPSSGSTSSTDPYAKKASATDPYGNTGSTGGTDPYSGDNGQADYNARLSASRNNIDRLDNEYRWLYANEASWVDDRTRTEAASLLAARAQLARYDLSRKDAYINADSSVQQAAQRASQSNQRAQLLASLAREAGY